jgi:hypothetical protein
MTNQQAPLVAQLSETPTFHIAHYAKDRFAPKAVDRSRFSTQAGHASDAPGGRSIFGRFALAIGPQEIVHMGKMGKGNMRVRTGLPPWRRSADRTRLPANSVLTGNFAILELRDTI